MKSLSFQKIMRRKALNALLKELSPNEHGNTVNDIQFANITRSRAESRTVHCVGRDTGSCDKETLELRD